MAPMVERRLRRTPTWRELVILALIIGFAATIWYVNRSTPRFPEHKQTEPAG